MASPGNWAFPDSLQPSPDETRFDLAAALDAVVLLRAEIPEDAFTAQILGTERAGNGIVIRDDGLVLTIGYLITEAESIWLTTNRGTVVQGHVLGYDQATGFGLVLPLGKLGVQPLARGSAAAANTGAPVIVIGQGGRAHSLKAKIVAKREFAGYWEYVLDEALFTAPAHPQWGGAALLGEDGSACREVRDRGRSSHKHESLMRYIYSRTSCDGTSSHDIFMSQYDRKWRGDRYDKISTLYQYCI